MLHIPDRLAHLWKHMSLIAARGDGRHVIAQLRARLAVDRLVSRIALQNKPRLIESSVIRLLDARKRRSVIALARGDIGGSCGVVRAPRDVWNELRVSAHVLQAILELSRLLIDCF